MTSSNVTRHPGHLTRDERALSLGGRGATVWITGLSGSGKSTVAAGVEQRLVKEGRGAYLLDGDNLRTGLNGDLGFSRADREENVRRIYRLALAEAEHGAVVLVAVISPYRSVRDQLRLSAPVPFFEVFVDAPLPVCEQRDPKGLYRRARAGELKGFTGIDDPYEAPESPDIHCRTDLETVAESCARVLRVLEPWTTV